MNSTAPTYYDIIGVGPNADSETLRRAYRRLARKHHPDVSRDPKAHENMARINEAFETLIDSARREEYDAVLRGVPDPRRERTPDQPIVVKFMRRLIGHRTPVYALAWSPDTGELISSAFDNEIFWWNEDGLRVRRAKVDSGVISTLKAFSDGRLVAAGASESQISMLRFDGDQIKSWRAAQVDWVSCVAISGDGAEVAAGSVHRTLAVANAETGVKRLQFADYDDSVTALAYSADGKLLATGTADAIVRVRSNHDGAVVATLDRIRSVVSALAFSSDKRYLAVASVDLSIRVFNLQTQQLVKMLYGHDRPIETLAFHPNGWLIASGSRDGTVGLWNAAQGVGNCRIEVSSRPISAVAFSPDGTRLAVAGQDKVVRVWAVTAKQVEAQDGDAA